MLRWPLQNCRRYQTLSHKIPVPPRVITVPTTSGVSLQHQNHHHPSCGVLLFVACIRAIFKKSQSARYLRALVVEFGRVFLARAAAVVS